MSTSPLKSPIAIGWVPNVIGSICYNLLNKDGTNVELADYRIHHSSELDNNGQYRDEQIIHTALCDINDQDIEPNYSRYIRHIIYGEKDQKTKNLVGKVWKIKLIRNNDSSNDQLAGITSKYHVNIMNKLDKLIDYSKSSRSSRYPNKKIPEMVSEIEDVILFNSQEKETIEEGFIAESAEFKLQKDGLFYLYPIKRYLVDEVEYKELNGEDNFNYKEIQELAEDFSIRIKQLFHAHHHHLETDDFLSCVAYQKDLEEPLLKMIRNLKHSISHERRMFLSKGFIEKDAANLIGLTAYGKTLTKICENNLLSKKNDEKNDQQIQLTTVPSMSQHFEYFDSLKTSVEAHKMSSSLFIYHFMGRPPLILFPVIRVLLITLPLLTFAWLFLNLIGHEDYFKNLIESFNETDEDTRFTWLRATLFVFLVFDFYNYFKYGRYDITIFYLILNILLSPIILFNWTYKKLLQSNLTAEGFFYKKRLSDVTSKKHYIRRFLFRAKESIAIRFRYRSVNNNKANFLYAGAMFSFLAFLISLSY